jgi:FKBP-type peptidyl-prolyl cis-trans isomerase SlyD
MRSLGTLLALLPLLAAASAGAQSTAAIERGSSVKIEYTLKDDQGVVVDTTKGKEPLAYTQGTTPMIPGLEKALMGMKAGDSKQVVVAPEDGFGPVDPKKEQEVPKDVVPPGSAVVGARLLARSQDGRPVPVTVKAVKDNVVVLDLNHPLAGKTLFFDITVVSVEPPAK